MHSTRGAPALPARVEATLPTVPRIVFVLGKGGSGRSSVAAALGQGFAARGEETLIVQWSKTDSISPWFGEAPAGHTAQRLADRLSTMSFSLDETLREYFVDHLGLHFLHDTVVASSPVRTLVHAAPGITELLFCGRLFWLSALARTETGKEYARIVVDAPATGHGRTLFALPSTLEAMGPAGLLAVEAKRVAGMLRDPAWTGALVVTLAEELGIEEALEQIPRLRQDLGRQPLGFVVNRSAAAFEWPEAPVWLSALEHDQPAAAPTLHALHAELRARRLREALFRSEVDGSSALGVASLEERLLYPGSGAPREVVDAQVAPLQSFLRGAP